MIRLINATARRFAKDEDGAVTVDFVVLCGAVVAIGIAAAAAINTQVTTAAGTLGAKITAAEGG